MKLLARRKPFPRLLLAGGALLAVLFSALPLTLRAAPGSVDTTFAVGQQLGGQVYQVAQQPDGHIVVLYLPVASTTNPNPTASIAQLDANGNKVASFGTGGFGGPLTGTPTSMIVDSLGRIVYVGNRANSSDLTAPIDRLTADGQVDTTFAPGAFQTAANGGNAYTVLIQPGGSLLVGGDFKEYNGVERRGLVRLDNNGNVDASFVPPPASTTQVSVAAAKALGVQTGSGKVVVYGSFVYNGASRAGLIRLSFDGTLDSSFVPVIAGGGTARYKGSLAIQAGGGILVGGDFTTLGPVDLSGGINQFGLARLSSDGKPDQSFTPLLDGGLAGVVLQPDGKILVAGGFSYANNVLDLGVARLNADGTTDTSFSSPFLFAESPSINSVALQADSKVLVAGAFGSTGGVRMQNIARLLVVDTPTPPAGAITVPGTSNIWLAGAAPGTTASSGQDNLTNATPFQVPNLTLVPGQSMTFSATGNVSNDPARPVTVGPDGGPYLGFTLYKHDKENGIADLAAPVNSLVGVFLDDSTPNPVTAPDGYNLSQPPGTDYTLIGPALRKPFFIGDGKTTDGTVQKILVPSGATRLFLGSLDPSDQENNVGSFFVKVNGGTVTPPTTGAKLVVNSDDFSYTVKNQPNTGTVVPGDQITYSLTVRNTGTAPAANVVVKASLDVNNSKLINKNPISDGGAAAANVVTWTLPSLANGDHKTLTYSVKVKGNADAASGIRLGAAVLSATADAPATPLSTANLPSIGLTVVPLFNISTQSDGVTAVAGGPLTFTFTVVNRGTTLVSDITVDVPLPDGYLPANFKTATFIDDSGNPVGAPYKLGANLDNGQFDPAAVRLYINGLSAGESKRFTVTINVPYDATPGSTINLPPMQLNGYIGDGKVAYNQPPYGTKISNNPPLAPPKVTLAKLSPTSSEIDGLRLAALASPKTLIGKVGKQLLQAIADATGKTTDQLNALTSDQIIALINPYVTVDTDTDNNGKLLLDVPAPNAKQPAPYVTYVVYYLNTSATGTAAGITISDALAPGLKLDPDSVYVKGKKVAASTVSDGNGNLTFTDKNIKPDGGGVITYHALVPAADTSTLNPGDIIQPVTASLTTASISSQSFGTPYEDGILVTGPTNAVCESGQVSSNQVTADGNVIYNIYYKNTGGTKSKDFLVVSPIPAGAVYRSTYVPTAGAAAIPSASFLTVGQQVRPADQTKGEGIVEPAGANTAAGATSGLVVFHLSKVKPRGLGFVQVVYKFSPALFAQKDVSIKHQPYVDSGSFPKTNGVLTRPTPRALQEGPHTRDFSGSVIGVFKPAVPNTTHLFTPLPLLGTPASQSGPQIPHLSILQTGPLAVVEGGTFQYAFAVTNTSDVPSGTGTFNFIGPVDASILSTGGIDAAAAGGFSATGFILNLGAHQTRTITVTVRATAKAGSTLLFNTAFATAINVQGTASSGVVGVSGMATTVITAAQASDANQLSLVQSAIATNAVQAQGISATSLLSAPNFAERAAKITPDSLQTTVAGADVVSLDQGAALVAAGAGNLVAAGAGNLIAAGAGNLVAAGAGNLIAAGAGNLITLNGINGLGTLNGSDLLLPANLSKLVAAGAGNLVAAGAGNLISQDGSGLLSNVTGLASSTLASLQDHMVVAGIGNAVTQGLISQDGSGVVSNDGGSLISQDGAGIVSHDGGGIVAAGAGNLVAAGAGNRSGSAHPAPGQPHTRDITSDGGIRLGSPDNSKYVHFNNAGGFVFSVNPDLKNQ